MKKTSVYLEAELDSGLAWLADREGTTKAELIRSVLRRALQDVDRPSITAIGVEAGPGNVADDVDAALHETGFGQW